LRGAPAVNPGAVRPAPDYSRLNILVLVGKLGLDAGQRLVCFGPACRRPIESPDTAWLFRRRTRSGLEALVYCESCKARARHDRVSLILFPDGNRASGDGP